MTDTTRQRARLKRRFRAERRFRFYGFAAILISLAFLGFMFFTIGAKGWSAFEQTEIALDIAFDGAIIDPDGKRDPLAMAGADYDALVKASLQARFPGVGKRRDKRSLKGIVSDGAGYLLADMVAADPSLIGKTMRIWVAASDDVDQFMKGRIDAALAENVRQLNDRQIGWLQVLIDDARIELRFNKTFFTAGDSREPELAGILGAAVGSFLSLMVCLLTAFPLGVATSLYLQEFAPKNRWTDLIEVNINNLAAVPSIIFGLLGLAVFLNVMGLPRSAPLAGGFVLALMTLPTIIIAGRVALQAVPPSIREAALALGASPVQAVFHHVLPLAMPGMLTGTIIGMARALGETAPLLMIGMIAFVVDIPKSFLDPATALPVQIFLWADSPERAFEERTSAAIIVLLAFLIAMNLTAVLLRRKYEIKW